MDKKIPTLSNAIAFNLIMNGGSFLFLFIIISGFFSNSFEQLILSLIENEQLKSLISYFFNYQNNIPYSIMLIITSIYSASSLYYHLMGIVEFITDMSYKISISKRILAIIITIIYLLMLNFITLIFNRIIIYFKILSIFIVLFIFIFTIYVLQIISLKTYKIKKLYKGILFTIIYFILFTIGFYLYLKIFSNFKIVYGVLSFFIILFFYLYMMSIGLLLGINLNHLINNKKCQKIICEEVKR